MFLSGISQTHNHDPSLHNPPSFLNRQTHLAAAAKLFSLSAKPARWKLQPPMRRSLDDDVDGIGRVKSSDDMQRDHAGLSTSPPPLLAPRNRNGSPKFAFDQDQVRYI